MGSDDKKNAEFKNIKFGDSDARTEMNYSPDLLIDGFLDENGYIDKLIKDRFYLVYGLKGSGKTAIASRLKLISNDDPSLMVEQYSLERFNYSLFEGMGYNSSPESSSHKHSRKMPEVQNLKACEIVLNTALLTMFSQDPNLRSKDGSFVFNVINGLKKWGIIASSDFSMIVNKMSKNNIIVDLKLLKFEHSSSTESTNAYDAAYDNLRNAIFDAVPSRKTLLVIDGIDSIVTEREVQNRVLSGLLHATSEINSSLRERGVNAKIILLCRKDLLDSLKDPNKQKIIGDFGFELNWYDSGVDRDDINLIKLLNLRAKLSLDKDVNIFDDYLSPMVDRKKTYKFILDHTRHIPRDIVCLMNEIQKVYKNGDMNPSRYYNAVKTYSANYFYGEVQDELVGIMSDEEVQTIFKLISENKKYRTSKRELEIKAQELSLNLKNLNLERSLSLLYDIGAIGNVRKVEGKDSYSFKYRDRWSSFNQTDELVIHLALQKALNVRGGYTNQDVDYD